MKKSIVVLFIAFSSSVFSQTSGELLQSKLNAIKSMSANFSQVVKAKKREVSHSSGTMALERPGRFRWQTKSPMEQLVIADGKKMWVYDVDLEQVTVKKQEKGLGGTAVLFLSGYDDTVARDFEVTQKDDASGIVFDLKSKSSKANFQRIKLIFNKDNLTGLELFDQLGQVTVVKLAKIKSNPKLSVEMFQFKVPKNIDLIQQ